MFHFFKMMMQIIVYMIAFYISSRSEKCPQGFCIFLLQGLINNFCRHFRTVVRNCPVWAESFFISSSITDLWEEFYFYTLTKKDPSLLFISFILKAEITVFKTLSYIPWKSSILPQKVGETKFGLHNISDWQIKR